MLSKKSRRQIMVDGVLYHYTIKGSTNAVIYNTETAELIKWNDSWDPKSKNKLKLSDIENIIRIHEVL